MVVSDVGGLPEVVKDEETGVIVEKENPQEAGNALVRLIVDKDLRNRLGEKGVTHIKMNYDWLSCVIYMEKILTQVKLFDRG